MQALHMQAISLKVNENTLSSHSTIFNIQGDNCPDSVLMGDDCHGYGFAILLTSGVTCALLVFDLATRYLLRKKEEEEVANQQTVAAFSAPRARTFEPITEEDRELLLGGTKSEVSISVSI